MIKKLNTLNKKLQFLLLSFISLYFLVYFFIISPKIKEHLVSNEYMYYEIQLKKISEIINSHAISLFNYEKSLDGNDNKQFLLKKRREEEIIKITTLIKQLKIKENGYILLIDKKTHKYIHPFKEIHNKDIRVVSKLLNQNLYEMVVKSFETKQPMKYMWHKKNKLEKLYKKIAWVSYNKYFNFYIVSAAYEEDILKIYERINKTIIILSIIMFLIIYIIILNYVKKITTPLNNLILNITTFKKGNYEKNSFLEINSNDEFELLNNEFKDMKNKIVNNIIHLENQISLRTKELKRKLYIDELTQLKNNYALIERLKEKESASIIILSVNKFRDINELYGYEVGNALIQKISKILKKVAKKNKLKLFKLESVTFAFLKEGSLNFNKFSEKIIQFQKKINNKSIYLDEIKDFVYLNTTLGISISHQIPLKSAITALNKAKRENKDYCFFNDTIDEKTIININNQWNKKIKHAISSNNIVPFYQAIVNDKKKIIKYEVLMRLKEKSKKEIIFHSPYHFLDISKKTNQYEILSSIIIHESLKKLTKTSCCLSINMNYNDTQDENIKNLLNKYIKNRKIGKRLTIEILEDDQILDYNKLNDFVNKYKKLGVKFAIDDFGAGYSNLLNVIKLKPDFLKIDGSLIKNIDKDPISFSLVQSIVKFSEQMNIKVIAEFVHDKTTFNKLKKLNIYGYQGYYFYKPKKILKFKNKVT